ncbi:hypothetical protein A2U01_0006846 [Trifolium medium]|uniref:Uncharacterized protein n=1 Tax=Trifolium medium TaxID=97028 RepID=A0A392MFN7_9FABA|nr:hypothetical protein [Trifolium medium]
MQKQVVLLLLAKREARFARQTCDNSPSLILHCFHQFLCFRTTHCCYKCRIEVVGDEDRAFGGGGGRT